jgi:hypothetical protein
LAGAITGWSKPGVRFAVLQMAMLLVFWIGFTHLQGRFFLLAVPLCGLLLAHMPWERMPAWAHVCLAVLVGVAAIGGAVELVRQWPSRMDEISLNAMLGQDTPNWPHGPNNLEVPDDATLVLVGEAKAFYYTRPMTRLQYRTIFDLDTGDGRTLLEAYGVPAVVPPGEYLLVDPAELERFEKTYRPLAPIPAAWKAMKEPFIVPPGTAIK